MKIHVLLAGMVLGVALAGGNVRRSPENVSPATPRGGEVVLGNQYLDLVMSGEGQAVRLVNKLSGRTLQIRQDDFAIGLADRPALQRRDFTLKNISQEKKADGQQLTVGWQNPATRLQVQVVYSLSDQDFFFRRELRLQTDKPLELRRLDVWLVGLAGTGTHQGFGSPVLLDDTFWGVEFPAGENVYESGTIRLSHFPGRKAGPSYVSKSLVAGVAEKGGSAPWFQKYVETFRSAASRNPLFVNYNTWWTLMPPSEKNSLELIEQFRRRLFVPYGESIDTFTLDDGWDIDNSLWGINDKAFPRGFGPLVEALKAQKARLGIWLSPSSGYNHAPWLAAHGYRANSNPWYLCSSDPKYRRDIVRVVTDLARKYNVAFFKFDGFCASCDAPGHAHLPGPYAREANVEAFIELLTAVRQVQPNVYLDPTCGIWLSPWWLKYADSLWGEVSGDYPDIIVPAPVVRDSATTTRDAVFRQRCREHPGFPPAAIEHLGIIVISPEKWEDNAMIVAGRGCRLLTLYIDPQNFRHGERDWKFLASLLKWLRANAATLRHTKLILGDPMKREPYGYAHFHQDKGILALRNPFIEPKTVTVKLDETVGWSPLEAGKKSGGTGYLVRTVYPRHEVLSTNADFGSVLTIPLQGYESTIIQVDPMDQSQVLVLGKHFEEERRTGNRVTFTVMDKPEKLPGCRVESSALAPPDPKLQRITGRCVVQVPEKTQAAIHILCDVKGPVVPVKCLAKVNGRTAEVRGVCTPEKGDQAHGPHPWTWFEFPVPSGRSEVTVTVSLDSKAKLLQGDIGWWLWVEHILTRQTLTMDRDGPLPPPEPLPLPIQNDRMRQIIRIGSPVSFGFDRRWPEGPFQKVWLDEVSPDEVAQDYGQLEVNRSVWHKDMVIAGGKFTRGLGTHANGRLVYRIGGQGFKKFKARVGRDEHAGDGRIIFQVWLDGRKLFDSGAMTKTTAAKSVDVDVTGGKTLELRALDGGDGLSGDHANWAEAQLQK